MSSTSLLTAIHAGIVAFAMPWGTCPIHLYNQQRAETEGLVILPRPSQNHPDVAGCYSPFIFDCRVLHRRQETAWRRGRDLFNQFEAFKPYNGEHRVWSLNGWDALATSVEAPVCKPTRVEVAGALLTDVTVSVRLLVRRV